MNMNVRRASRRTLLAAASAGLVLSFTAASAVSSGTYEAQVITRTNAQRVAHDKVEVKLHSCLDRWAEGQARWMAKYGKLEHRKGRLGQMMDDCHMSSAAENIAYGYPSGNSVVSGWMNSSGHRANILRTRYRYIGVGAVQSDDGVWWVSQTFSAK